MTNKHDFNEPPGRNGIDWVIECGFMVGNAAQDTEKGLASLFGSFHVQPCANN